MNADQLVTVVVGIIEAGALGMIFWHYVRGLKDHIDALEQLLRVHERAGKGIVAVKNREVDSTWALVEKQERIIEKLSELEPDVQMIEETSEAGTSHGRVDEKVYRSNVGSLLLEAGRHEEAAEQLQRAIDLDPYNMNAQYNLGAAYINHAIQVNERIGEVAAQLREESEKLTPRDIESIEQELKQLGKERTSLFEKSIPPLEIARELTSASGNNSELRPICRALHQSYVQTGQDVQAQGVAECAGYD